MVLMGYGTMVPVAPQSYTLHYLRVSPMTPKSGSSCSKTSHAQRNARLQSIYRTGIPTLAPPPPLSLPFSLPTPVPDIQALALKSVDYTFASEQEKMVLRERMRREMGLDAA